MNNLVKVIAGTLLLAGIAIIFTSCKYMKMDPPPDVDKAGGGGVDNSCWMATASNMLAGAGYGNGTTVQDRADDIYADMLANYDVADRGWTDAALSWWLGSANNTWSTTNPYSVVTVYGYKTRTPWDEPDGAMFIGNELRRCQLVGLSISWTSKEGGHAITAWGDNFGKETLELNPVSVMVTDSDRDDGGDVQEWEYDDYNNPNPGTANSGDGWYINYEDDDHPFIKHIITLCPTDDPTDGLLTQKVLGSYKIHQSVEEAAAIDLHYTAKTDVEILSYRTWIDWTEEVSPTITEADPRESIDVDWDLQEYPVEYCTEVTINTEFVLPRWNAIWYEDVHFTYSLAVDTSVWELIRKPDIYWRLYSPLIERADQIQDVTGGYVLASFDIVDPRQSAKRRIIGEYRLVHQYNYDENPEIHEFYFAGENGFLIENLKFGHSYGYPSARDLWEFEKWMTVIDSTYALGEELVPIKLDWLGELPYPKGEVMPDDIKFKVPEN